jgi:hypothetical protein
MEGETEFWTESGLPIQANAGNRSDEQWHSIVSLSDCIVSRDPTLAIIHHEFISDEIVYFVWPLRLSIFQTTEKSGLDGLFNRSTKRFGALGRTHFPALSAETLQKSEINTWRAFHNLGQ